MSVDEDLNYNIQLLKASIKTIELYLRDDYEDLENALLLATRSQEDLANIIRAIEIRMEQDNEQCR